MALVELVRCTNAAEAAILRTRLEAEGIDAFVFDAEMSWLPDGNRVLVDADDLAQARRIIGEA